MNGPKSGAIRQHLGSALAVAALLGGAALLYTVVSRYDAGEILRSVRAADIWRIIAAVGLAAASYVSLTVFDWLALRYAGKPLVWHRAAWASFTSLSIGHNVGLAVLSSGAIRYRFYSRWGLTTFEVGKVIVFCGATVVLGLSTLGGLALLLRPQLSGQVLGIGRDGVLLAGGLCLALPVAYVMAAFTRVGRIRFRHWELEIPSLRMAVQQVLLGTLNYALVAGCLHQCINAVASAPYTAVATTYVLANTVALVSHVPGGLGIIESSVVYLLPSGGTVAAVLLFRAAYFLLPLPLGLLSFVLSELMISRKPQPAE